MDEVRAEELGVETMRLPLPRAVTGPAPAGVSCEATLCLMRADCRVGIRSYAAPCKGLGGVPGVEVICKGGVVAIL